MPPKWLWLGMVLESRVVLPIDPETETETEPAGVYDKFVAVVLWLVAVVALFVAVVLWFVAVVLEIVPETP